MKKSISVIVVISLFLITSSCATYSRKQEPAQRSSVREHGSAIVRKYRTTEIVESKIIEGETTHGEIHELFGSPNKIRPNRYNDEVWNYRRMSYKTTSGADGVSVIFFSVSNGMTIATGESFDLILIFDENFVVKYYTVIAF